MKALVYLGPEQLEIRDVAEPPGRSGHSVVQIASSGICGSDMHAYLGHDERRPAPLILGHEASGIVRSGGKPGRRVTINPLVTCGRCAACTQGRNNLCVNRQIISMPPREGAFAEMVAIPDENLVTVPDDVSFDRAALAEPLACGWHAVRLAGAALAVPLAKADCLVIGGGAIGLGAALVLVSHGARSVRVAETNAARRKTLHGLDIFDVADPSATPIRDVDLVVDAVGFVATRAEACRAVRPGGVIVHIGLGQSEGGLDVRRMTLQEITFIGTYTYTPQDFRDTAQAMFDGKLGSLDWMDVRPLSEGAAAFADIRSGRAAAPKIILKP